MLTTNKPDTSGELLFKRYRSGIKLARPEAGYKAVDNHQFRVGELLQYPFNVYFLSANSIVQRGNELHASTLGYTSPQAAVGTDIFDICKFETAQRIRDNDRRVIETRRIMITEEDHVNIDNDGIAWQCLTIKSPWYDQDDRITGVFGCSIVLGRQAIAESLQRITALGLLNIDNGSAISKAFSSTLCIDGIRLSRRETDCIRLQVRGKTAAEIAGHLSLSKRTVEHHIENIKLKLNVKSRSELIDKVIDAIDNE